MAQQLIFDNSSYAEINAITLGDNFEFRVKLETSNNVTTEQWVVSFWDDSSINRATALRIKDGTLQTYFSPDGFAFTAGPTRAITSNTFYYVQYGKRAAETFLQVNNDTETTVNMFAGAVFNYTTKPTFGSKNNTNKDLKLLGGIESIELFVNSVSVNLWDSNFSDTSNTGLQPVLKDTIGTNDGQGFGFPVDGTAWEVSQAPGTTHTLKFRAANSHYTTLTTPIDFMSEENWIVRFIADIKLGELFVVLGSDSFSSNIMFLADDKIRIRASGVGTEVNLIHANLRGIGLTKYTITKTGDTVNLYLNEDVAPVATVVSTNIDNWVQTAAFKYVNRSVTSYGEGDLQALEVIKPTNLLLDASSSTHTGVVILKDIAGINDATGTNFAVDGTVWDELDIPPQGINISTGNYSFIAYKNKVNYLTITGSVAGTIPFVDYRVNGSKWGRGSLVAVDDTYSFNVVIPNQESVLEIRAGNDHTITNSITATAATVFACIGQSGMSSRGYNLQKYTPKRHVRAFMLGNDDVFKELADPYDSSADQVDSASIDGSAWGSWIVRFAHYWIQRKTTPVAFIPLAKGGSTIQDWQKGGALYTSMVRRVALTGGVNHVLFEQGESDAWDTNATTHDTYVTKLNQLVNDIYTDFGVKTYIVPLHTITANGYNGNGTTTGQVAIRYAQMNVAASNANCVLCERLDDIDISDGDKLHFKYDDELDTVAKRVFKSFVKEESPLDKVLAIKQLDKTSNADYDDRLISNFNVTGKDVGV